MDAGMTLSALLALILALSATAGADVAKKKKLQEAQEQFENTVRDNNVTASETQSLRGVNLNHNETLVRDGKFQQAEK